MKKLINLLKIIIILMITLPVSVLAAGSATESIGGSASATNGSNISLPVSLTNISGVSGIGANVGVASYEGNFMYDAAYFDFVSFTSNAPFSVDYNIITSGNVRFAGLSFSNSTLITGASSPMFTIVLKAKQVGTTNVSLANTELGDKAATIVNLSHPGPKAITITGPVSQSNNANLSSLSVSGYAISPTFDKNTTSYSVTVPYSATSVNINATKEDASASVTGTGAKSLSVGSNTASVIVTAEDGTKKTYTINITRESGTPEPPPTNLSSDATLKSLNVAGYSLAPTFKPETTSYTITIPSGIGSLDVSALASDSRATVNISGHNNLTAGTNNVTVRVAAEDGTVKTYIITVKRAETVPEGGTTQDNKSSNNYLKSLDIDNYPINFSKSVNTYSIDVPYEVNRLSLNMLPEFGNAKVEVIGNADFKVGAVNVVEIRVTAEDGSLRIYTINVNRSPESSQNKLESLDINGNELSPAFDPSIEDYYLKVKNSVKDLDLNYKAQDANAKVEVLGNKDLKVGNNIIKVKVTDSNGFTRTYALNVEKEPPFTILGMKPWLFAGVLTLFLLLTGLIIFLLRRKQNKQKTLESSEKSDISLKTQPINIEFKPEINIGSQNDSQLARDNAQVTHHKAITSKAQAEPKVIEYREAAYEEIPEKAAKPKITKKPDKDIDTTDDGMDNLMATLKYRVNHPQKKNHKSDLDELMNALKNKDEDLVKMFIKQVKADDLKAELRGINPAAHDDVFDDEVTVHEVVKALEKYKKTGDAKVVELLINQYEVNKMKEGKKKKCQTMKKMNIAWTI